MRNFWIAATATTMVFLAMGTARAQKTAASGADPVFETPTALSPQNRIDELVFAHWKQVGVEPSPLCSDAVFVRRAYLDAIGTLPTAVPEPSSAAVLLGGVAGLLLLRLSAQRLAYSSDRIQPTMSQPKQVGSGPVA